MPISTTQSDGGGDRLWMILNAMGELITTTPWEPELQVDEALNDSDKSFTVDADERWQIQSIWVEYTSTAVVGNREVSVEIQDDAADVIARVQAGVVQAASNTYYYTFAPHVADLTAVRNSDHVSTPIPEWELPPSYVIRVWDQTATDAAADDMVVQVLISKKEIS